MWNSNAADDDGTEGLIASDGVLRRYSVSATVTDDLIAAVEGWRRAHGVAAQPEALGELVRLGLMSEVAKIYRLVCGDAAASSTVDASPGGRRSHRSRRGDRKARPL